MEEDDDDDEKRGSLGESKSRSMERRWPTFTDYKVPDNVREIYCARLQASASK